MYNQLHRILINNIPRNYNARTFQYNIIRSKSYLISPHSFNYKEFVKVLPKLVTKISTDTCVQANVEEKIKKIAEYGCNDGNAFRGSLAMLTYENIEKHENIRKNTLHQIQTLAWCVEMLRSYFMILDDLDKSHEMAYWGNYEPSLLRSFVYEILKLEHMDKPTYVDIVHLFDKAFLNTTVGQHMDLLKRRDFNNFTRETFNIIADLKTSHHTFELPFFLAMKLVNNIDEHLYQTVQTTCMKLGRLYQMQTDYLDCYAEEADQFGIPKHSSDIQKGRCSWLAVTAMQRCTPAQRIVFRACYGSTQPAHVERVKLLYDKLEMTKIYKEEKEKMCDNIVQKAGCGNNIDNLIFKVVDVVKHRDDIQ